MKDLINSLGGPVAISKQLGVSPQAVSLWSSSGRIPVERVPALLRMAGERGLELSARQLRADFDWAAVCDCRGAA